ncbi:hypothetical protein A9C11_22910 [Pseudomonas citronellolis]|uniref:Uncharacterized protein n=1 Tax=Pseudomonas citronellolis TaxID=53408 RepID=A0A1A9KGL4_9PSED|nr:hypothetical protein [Pseudomonas citronellolis]ANI16644.1 hypothetical protein A9C11_22910 [Pseudomonas citronellolis]
MAISKCIKCDSSQFELKQASISGCRFIMNFVQCSHCGGVVGVIETDHLGLKLENLAKEVDQIKRRIR